MRVFTQHCNRQPNGQIEQKYFYIGTTQYSGWNMVGLRWLGGPKQQGLILRGRDGGSTWRQNGGTGWSPGDRCVCVQCTVFTSLYCTQPLELSSRSRSGELRPLLRLSQVKTSVAVRSSSRAVVYPRVRMRGWLTVVNRKHKHYNNPVTSVFAGDNTLHCLHFLSATCHVSNGDNGFRTHDNRVLQVFHWWQE